LVRLAVVYVDVHGMAAVALGLQSRLVANVKPE
jgi:hypothetical protein